MHYVQNLAPAKLIKFLLQNSTFGKIKIHSPKKHINRKFSFNFYLFISKMSWFIMTLIENSLFSFAIQFFFSTKNLLKYKKQQNFVHALQKIIYINFNMCSMCFILVIEITNIIRMTKHLAKIKEYWIQYVWNKYKNHIFAHI